MNVERGGYAEQVELVERGVAELDREPEQSYQVVMSGLCLSELSDEERAFALAQAHRVLEPGGLLLVADEVVPEGVLPRVLYAVIRFPLVVLTYLFARATTRALSDLPRQVVQAGFEVESYRRGRLHGFAVLVARRPNLIS